MRSTFDSSQMAGMFESIFGVRADVAVSYAFVECCNCGTPFAKVESVEGYTMHIPLDHLEADTLAPVSLVLGITPTTAHVPQPAAIGPKATDSAAGKAKRRHLEEDEQIALFQFLRAWESTYPAFRWIHSVPNGLAASRAVRGRAKMAGRRAGIWDIFVPVLRSYSDRIVSGGMYIELKISPNILTKDQKEYGAWLNSQNYKSAVCHSWQEAAVSILDYLGIDDAGIRRSLAEIK